MEYTLSFPHCDEMTAVTPPSEGFEFPAGDMSSPITPTSPSMAGTPSRSPTPQTEIPTARDGSISGRSDLRIHDPVWNPGHVLPQLPPPIHEADATWTELLDKLEFVARAPVTGSGTAGSSVVAVVKGKVQGFSKLELAWIANYQRKSAHPRCKFSVRYWEGAVLEFNQRFASEVSGRALRKQFLEYTKAKRAGGKKRTEVAEETSVPEEMDLGE